MEATTVTTAVVAVAVIVAEEKGSADDTAMKTCWGLSQLTGTAGVKGWIKGKMGRLGLTGSVFLRGRITRLMGFR